MADFAEVLRVAWGGYRNRDDFPPYALASWDERARWSEYLEKIAAELDAKTACQEESGAD